MHVPDDTPPFAVYRSPYGGLGLKTKSNAKARARIEGLLDIGTEIEHRLAELSVIEPANRALVEALHEPSSARPPRRATEDRSKTTAAFDSWTAYVAANDQAMYDDYSTSIQVRCIWGTRLRVAGGKVVGHPYPKSQIHANLRGRRSSAFLDVVLPHDAATDAFLADCQVVNRSLGMTIPMTGWKLCAPKKRGGGRVYKRLPGL